MTSLSFPVLLATNPKQNAPIIPVVVAKAIVDPENVLEYPREHVNCSIFVESVLETVLSVPRQMYNAMHEELQSNCFTSHKKVLTLLRKLRLPILIANAALRLGGVWGNEVLMKIKNSTIVIIAGIVQTQFIVEMSSTLLTKLGLSP